MHICVGQFVCSVHLTSFTFTCFEAVNIVANYSCLFNMEIIYSSSIIVLIWLPFVPFFSALYYFVFLLYYCYNLIDDKNVMEDQNVGYITSVIYSPHTTTGHTGQSTVYDPHSTSGHIGQSAVFHPHTPKGHMGQS